MDIYAAQILRCAIAHAPCTKLCLKQHSGLSMSAVLRAVTALEKEGWLRTSTYTVPRGGKPHTRVDIGTRPVYGAARGKEGYMVCALSLAGVAHLSTQHALPQGFPLTIVQNDLAPFSKADACALEQLSAVDTAQGLGTNMTTDDKDVAYMDRGQAIACYLAATGGGAYVDEDLRLHLAGLPARHLGELPSPMLAHSRLTYKQAMRTCSEAQKNRLSAELTQYIKCIAGVQRVCFAEETAAMCDAEAAARAGLYRLLWPTCDRERPH